MSKPLQQLYRETVPSLSSQHALFINRDLSLIEFFRRVLSEGLDESIPLLERVKFLSIFSNLIDEFYMTRMSSLRAKAGRNFAVSPDGLTPGQQYEQIRRTFQELCRTQVHCLKRDVLPKLREKGIEILKWEELAEQHRANLTGYFTAKIYPVLTPQAVDPSHPFPYISGGSLNIALQVTPHLHKKVASAMKLADAPIFVRIKIPPFLPRLIPVPGKPESFIKVENIISGNIASIVNEAKPEDCHYFRITRDTDIEVRESEAADLLEMMERNLKERRFGEVVRLEISGEMPDEMAEYLKVSLDLEGDDIYRTDGPLAINELSALSKLNRPELKERPLKVVVPKIFKKDRSKFDLIKDGDIMLHHPFMPYSIVTDFIKEAVEDPDVLAIKMCLYRLGEDSPIPELLMRASELGKQVTVLIELKARFDEENNIVWAKKLEEAGVHVIYGLLGLKTHAKTTLIVRREGDELRRYVHAATGNYNPQTSSGYTDLGLLTCDEAIGADATELFNFLTVYSQRKDFEKLLVAPINLRDRMVSMIEREAENARAGKPARIIAKINRLADSGIVNALYDASRAGVQIDLVVRGICTLRPGIAGVSENIRVRSIVGSLLEHSRVYYFENDGDPEIFMGSSDWMPRNLDRRVEVLTPVEDETIRAYLKNDFFPAYLGDNCKAWELQPDGSYKKASADQGAPLSCQQAFQGDLKLFSDELRTNKG